MLEAIALCEEIRGRKLTWSYEETNGSATTSVGSAMSESFRSITQPGNFGAVCNISRGVVAWSVNAYGNLFLGNSPIICAADRVAYCWIVVAYITQKGIRWSFTQIKHTINERTCR